MSRSDQDKWERIYRNRAGTPPAPAKVLVENLHLLPQSGTALDGACGTGANALLLARRGLQTRAWDISAEALTCLNGMAATENLELVTEQRDIIAHPPLPDTFDVIVVSRFLDRSIISPLMNALRRDGIIYYQTFIKDKRDTTGPGNPDYRLDNNELLRLFSDLHLVYYREEGTIGDISEGFRNEAMLIAQRR